jgi:hypothetical protein
LIYLGPANDLVMRASIPALAALAIRASLALVADIRSDNLFKKRIVLACMLAVGAVTPIQEFARALLLASWPINFDATLIGANCGAYPPHYIALLGSQTMSHVLRSRQPLAIGPQDSAACENPAIRLMYQKGLL